MSHFSVMVIGDNIEKELAPYQENNMGDCPEEYLVFNSVEEELKKNYETEEVYPDNYSYSGLCLEKDDFERVAKSEKNVLIQNVLCKNNEYGKELDKNTIYALKNADFCVILLDIKESGYNSFVVTLKKIDIPKKVKIKEKMSFIDYMESYCGYKYCSKNQAFGYYENPNAKWDYYEIGGRWSNFLKLKEDGKYADSAILSDIDFDGMRNDAKNEAKTHYEKVEILMGGKIPKIDKTWIECINNYKNNEDARIFYYSQEGVKKFMDIISTASVEKCKENGIDIISMRFFGKIDNYQITKEEYANNAAKNAISAFALVKDGKWYEKGEMGWFGMSTKKINETEWNNKINELLNSLDQNTLITILDCHI